MTRQINKEQIEKEAKEILDKFAKALEKVEKEAGKEESHVDREKFERTEKENCISSSDKSDENSKIAKTNNDGFKQRILKNAPDKDDDFIIAEKGSWK